MLPAAAYSLVMGDQFALDDYKRAAHGMCDCTIYLTLLQCCSCWQRFCPTSVAATKMPPLLLLLLLPHPHAANTSRAMQTSPFALIRTPCARVAK